MATTKFIPPPIPSSHVSPPKSSPKRMMNVCNYSLLLPIYKHFDVKFGETPYGFRSHSFPRNAAELAEEHSEYSNVIQIKEALFAALQGINRGIFGVPSEKKSEIAKLVELLESQNPTPQPTLSLKKVDGSWKLIYSTITILGPKRTKLGLRDFITLGDFFQTINIAKGKAVNTIKFSTRGLNLLAGQLTIDASFKISSSSRVDISYNRSMITPDQLMNVFRKSYNLLLGIFNPEGWLEITYVDDCLRIGRDDKGNLFILERAGDDDDDKT